MSKLEAQLLRDLAHGARRQDRAGWGGYVDEGLSDKRVAEILEGLADRLAIPTDAAVATPLPGEGLVQEIARRMWEADPELPDNGYDDVHDLEREVRQTLVIRADVLGDADAGSVERDRIRSLLHRASAGRAAYAERATGEARIALTSEAQALTNAARLVDDPSVMLGLMPSRMWTAEEHALAGGGR